MATKKFSALPAATGFTVGDEKVTGLQGGANVNFPIALFRDSVSVRDYGAVGDGVTDDTAAFQAAIDFVYANGGGTVTIPEGDYGITSIVRVWAAEIPVNLVGAGRRATTLTKLAGTSTPIIDFSAASNMSSYSYISDLAIQGLSKTHTGILMTALARFEFARLYIRDCDIGIDIVGALVGHLYECTIQFNNTGLRTRKSVTPNISPNLFQFFGGQFGVNTSWGVDLGDANGCAFYGTDLSTNGTTVNLNTGAMIVRDTVDDESGVAGLALYNVWMENNLGMTLKVEAAASLHLQLSNVLLLASEGGNAADIGAIRSLTSINTMAASGADVFTTAAISSTIIGGIIANLVDNSASTSLVNGVQGASSTKACEVSGLIVQGNVLTGSTTLFASQSGRTFYLNSPVAGLTVTLPTVQAGLKFTFLSLSNAPAVNYTINCAGGASSLYGKILDVVGELQTFSTKASISMVATVAPYMDRIEVECNGTHWHCVGMSSADGGIVTA